MEKDENQNVQSPDQVAPGSPANTQTALDEDAGIQTAVHETQEDISSDQDQEPSPPSQILGQNTFSPQEQEIISPADDVGNTTATEPDITTVSGTSMEKDENPNVQSPDQVAPGSPTNTQTALDEDAGIQTAVHETQEDISSDQDQEPSPPSQILGQDTFSPQEQEIISPADDVKNTTATEPDITTVSGTSMEKDENPNVQSPDQVTPGSSANVQTALDEDAGIQTAVHETQEDISSDQDKEPCPPSQILGQDTFSPQEQEIISPADDVGNSTATVKILLLPDGHMMTVAFMIGLTIQDLKNNFSNELRVPSELIQITLNGNALEDHQTLMSLGVQPHATVQFEMSSLDPAKYPIKPVKPQQECNMPDVITVRVQTDADSYQDVVVEIERTTQKDPFLGGYRQKVTKTEFYHAAVQTMPKIRPDKGVETLSRDTQTLQVKTKAEQCTTNSSTQMTKPGCYISNMEDKVITPRKYISADECHSRFLNAVITIQAHIRRWLAIRLTTQLRLDKELCLAWIEQERRRWKEEKEEQIRTQYQRRINPETKEDFAVLYNALEKWRKEELERINATLCGAERKAALCALLEQETQFLASIEHHRIAAGKRNQEKGVQAFLNKCAAPKQWQASDGTMTQMDTTHTIRARELRDLYHSITMSDLSQEERLDVLSTLKNTVKEHSCKLTQEIVELIEREADLMTRGMMERNLEGLRKRIATLFLQYIKNPTFNPEVSKLLWVPQDPEQLKKKNHMCRGCSKFLPRSEFPLTLTSRMMGLCRHCKQLDNEARHREDFTHYRNILKRLRKDESELNPDAKIPYLLQERDMRYLVDVIWRAQSAVSAWKDLLDLLMVRWDRYSEWTPWNCVLLTKEEAVVHLKVESIEKIYAAVFISSIKHKHAIARTYFSQIPVMVKYLQDVNSQPVAQNNLLVSKSISTISNLTK
ncbi:IQ and ubiquitin-like domain-containing protein isoform X1 [Silurus asotus]|uniref:IQ and ubiquitin-like domain-containing protein isoform X1 n=1 Tax=Silurus asotus TaxID=30991 RepID=A0AAD5FT42_SILAS|nr:IQ and ubiquitin-like domain-containing protein isoform X1 [Silurus asotus]